MLLHSAKCNVPGFWYYGRRENKTFYTLSIYAFNLPTFLFFFSLSSDIAYYPPIRNYFIILTILVSPFCAFPTYHFFVVATVIIQLVLSTLRMLNTTSAFIIAELRISIKFILPLMKWMWKFILQLAIFVGLVDVFEIWEYVDRASFHKMAAIVRRGGVACTI